MSNPTFDYFADNLVHYGEYRTYPRRIKYKFPLTVSLLKYFEDTRIEYPKPKESTVAPRTINILLNTKTGDSRLQYAIYKGNNIDNLIRRMGYDTDKVRVYDDITGARITNLNTIIWGLSSLTVDVREDQPLTTVRSLLSDHGVDAILQAIVVVLREAKDPEAVAFQIYLFGKRLLREITKGKKPLPKLTQDPNPCAEIVISETTKKPSSWMAMDIFSTEFTDY